ncbi:MAG: hypothetical protein QM539_05720 [Alphaproteobacteria bacterium]|nr:hypothetical protein [Alphaproteobacteria bacterium]
MFSKNNNIKKLILITIVTVVMSIVYSSCKKEATCAFETSTLDNKTYKITFSIDSSGINIDNRLLSYIVCPYATYITFKSDGTYVFFTKACQAGIVIGTWATLSENSKNYIVFSNYNTEVFDFNCNTFKTQYTSNEVGYPLTYKRTYTLQQ